MGNSLNNIFKSEICKYGCELYQVTKNNCHLNLIHSWEANTCIYFRYHLETVQLQFQTFQSIPNNCFAIKNTNVHRIVVHHVKKILLPCGRNQDKVQIQYTIEN